jgi:hypothetical protein
MGSKGETKQFSISLTLTIFPFVFPSISWLAITGGDPEAGLADLVLLLGAGGVVSHDAGVDADRRSDRQARGRGRRGGLSGRRQTGRQRPVQDRLRFVVFGLSRKMNIFELSFAHIYCFINRD